MSGLSAFLVLLFGVVYTNAAVALYAAEEKPAEFGDQEGCYLKHLSKVIPYGDYYPDDSCSKYTCHSDNTAQWFTCGVAVINENSPCKLLSDKTKKYPDCCPTVKC